MACSSVLARGCGRRPSPAADRASECQLDSGTTPSPDRANQQFSGPQNGFYEEAGAIDSSGGIRAADADVKGSAGEAQRPYPSRQPPQSPAFSSDAGACGKSDEPRAGMTFPTLGSNKNSPTDATPRMLCSDCRPSLEFRAPGSQLRSLDQATPHAASVSEAARQ